MRYPMVIPPLMNAANETPTRPPGDTATNGSTSSWLPLAAEKGSIDSTDDRGASLPASGCEGGDASGCVFTPPSNRSPPPSTGGAGGVPWEEEPPHAETSETSAASATSAR